VQTQSALTGTNAQIAPAGQVPLHEPNTLQDGAVVVDVELVVVVVIVVELVDGQVNAQLTSPTSHCATSSASATLTTP